MILSRGSLDLTLVSDGVERHNVLRLWLLLHEQSAFLDWLFVHTVFMPRTLLRAKHGRVYKIPVPQEPTLQH